MNSPLECIEIAPRREPAAGSIIWLHGLGASGHDFEPIAPLMRLPAARFIFPHAPARAVTINMGMVMPAWYDILSLGPTDIREPEADIRSSAEQISALIERENQRGVPSERIVLAGFSQGGALALHVGIRHPQTLAGIMVLSAYQLLPNTLAAEQSEANLQTPLLCCHGSHDPMVPIARGRDAYAAVTATGRSAQWRDYPMGHEVCMEEVEHIAQWLGERLPQAAEG